MAGGYFGGQELNSIRYKWFEFPYNPDTSTYTANKTFAAHKYPDIAGEELEDMDIGDIVISGSGEFVGDDAYDFWDELNEVFKDTGTGKLYHPIYRDVKKALMTKLTATVEPRSDYVAYEFEFRNHNKPSTPKVVKSTTSTTSSSSSKSSSTLFKIGDIVLVSGRGYYTSYGDTPTTAEVTNRRGVVTNVNYSGSKQIHIDCFGWFALSGVKSAK